MGYWIEVLVLVFLAFLVVQLLRLLLADADLTLLFKAKYGTKTAQGCITEDDVFTLPLDLLAYDTHSKATQDVLNKFKQIDILVNNAGLGQNSPIVNTKLEVDKKLVELNYLGTLSLTKSVLPHMVKRKQGHIVVNSSLAAIMGTPYFASYSASKFALQGWFRALRFEETRNNIAVTLVCPGPVVSDIEENSITDTPGKTFVDGDMPQKWVSTERCAELIVVAIANKLDEVWIAENPALILHYLAQYMPHFFTEFNKRIGMSMFRKMRAKAGLSI